MPRSIPLAAPRSGAQIDQHALEIIRKVQPEVLIKPEPFDIERFFDCYLEEMTGVEPDYLELNPGIQGYTDIDEMKTVISLELMEDETQNNRRYRRSTMGHEAGHVIQHVPEFRKTKALLKFIHDAQHVRLRMYREEHVPLYRNPEWQAWRFSGALLMPTPTFIAAIEQGKTVLDLVEIFDVNPSFVETRLRSLKIEGVKYM